MEESSRLHSPSRARPVFVGTSTSDTIMDNGDKRRALELPLLGNGPLAKPDFLNASLYASIARPDEQATRDGDNFCLGLALFVCGYGFVLAANVSGGAELSSGDTLVLVGWGLSQTIGLLMMATADCDANRYFSTRRRRLVVLMGRDL